VERLLRIDPLTPFYRMLPGFVALMQGDLRAAIGPFSDAVTRDPANPVVRQFFGQIQVMNGMKEEATKTFRALHADAPETFFAGLGMLFVHALNDDAAAATAVLTEEFRTAALGDAQYAWSLAQAAAMLGDDALAWTALDAAAAQGFWNAEFLTRHDPLIAPLRGTDRFRRLVEGVVQKAGELES
jgi:non-specific serine/threonine protein kinase